MKIEVLRTWGAVPAAEWDALVGDKSPFLEHTFLRGVEDSGAAVPDTGWDPRPVLVRDDAGKLVGGASCWLKDHSMGEFVYDFGWADAAHRAGLTYYPKLIVAVPFSPVTGDRLLAVDDVAREAVLAGIIEASQSARGVHVLFPSEAEAAWLGQRGLFPRIQHQFWWRNRDYTSWEHFIEGFPSKDRNKLRRERKECSNLRIDTYLGPDRAVIDQMYDFYLSTTSRHSYGHAYLTRELFRWLGDRWGDRLHVVVARDGDTIVAGSLNVQKGDRLYGRYWGCLGDEKFVHFEVCYHRAIDWCIANGLQVFEPGHGGDHKFKRGFLPEVTWSAHALSHPGLNRGLAEWSRREAEAVHADVAALRAASPLKVPARD